MRLLTEQDKRGHRCPQSLKQRAKVEFTKHTEKQLTEKANEESIGSQKLKERNFFKEKGSNIDRSNGIRLKNVYWIWILYIKFGSKRITGCFDENNLNGMLGSEAI